MKKYFLFFLLCFVAGGASRGQSVFNEVKLSVGVACETLAVVFLFLQVRTGPFRGKKKSNRPTERLPDSKYAVRDKNNKGRGGSRCGRGVVLRGRVRSCLRRWCCQRRLCCCTSTVSVQQPLFSQFVHYFFGLLGRFYFVSAVRARPRAR